MTKEKSKVSIIFGLAVLIVAFLYVIDVIKLEPMTPKILTFAVLWLFGKSILKD